jgi:hypothetical protein
MTSIVEGATTETNFHANDWSVAEAIQLGGKDPNANPMAAFNLLLPPWVKFRRFSAATQGRFVLLRISAIDVESQRY